MNTLKRLFSIIIISLVILGGLATTGLSFEPNSFVDPDTGMQVNSSTPEYTVSSYWEMMDNKGYNSAFKLYTPAAQELVSIQDLSQQYKINQITAARMGTVFPAMVMDNVAAVAYLHNMVIAGSAEEKPVLGYQFLKRDMSNRWLIIGASSEIPARLQVAFYTRLIEMDKSIKETVAKGEYSLTQKDSISSQLQSILGMHQEQLKQLTTSSKIKLPSVDFGALFISNYAQRQSYIWAWRYPNSVSTSTSSAGSECPAQ